MKEWAKYLCIWTKLIVSNLFVFGLIEWKEIVQIVSKGREKSVGE